MMARVACRLPRRFTPPAPRAASVLARKRFRRYFTYEEAIEYVSWLHPGAEVVRDPAESVVRGTVETAGGSVEVYGLP